jgi:hypothetical protein
MNWTAGAIVSIVIFFLVFAVGSNLAENIEFFDCNCEDECSP